jgi:hypothetical protein
MICSNCGQEVVDSSPSCPHCGKIFTNRPAPAAPVKNQPLPEAEIDIMPKSGLVNRTPAAIHEEKLEVHKAVGLRRKQRWFFYVLLIILFLGAVAMLVKVYNDNTVLLNQITGVNQQLDAAKQEAAANKQQLDAASTSLQGAQAELTDKAQALTDLSGKYDPVQANLVNVILQTGLTMDVQDLKRIAYADQTVAGTDTDTDGLSDEVETALGTDKTLSDTDNDGYTDRDELLRGYNPLGTGNLGVDSKFGDQYKGRLLLQTKDTVTYAWYIGLNGQRYYLGSSVDNFAAMSQNEYWVKK